MRNLKRALSLALASVMVMGMMVVGTSASYKDVDDADNVEAIEVLQAVSIMAGDDNGNFNPDAKVTRNEMAVIMSNLLNLDYDYYRGVNPFSDVPSWAAPYVAACVAEGVTAGIGNGLYGGANNVTASQAALMIMKALGYFQYPNDFGEDWQVATIRQASYIDLFDGVNANAETPLTRNQVAQMVLNGLQADMVTFTGDVGMTVNGVSFGYRAEYTARSSSDKKYDSLVGGSTDIAVKDKYIIQLGEELYNGKLQMREDTDAFERPATTWIYDKKEIGTYVDYDQMIESYTDSVSGKDLYDVLGKAIVENSDYEISVYVDGIEQPVSVVNEISKNNKTDFSDTGRGVLTQVFVDKEAEEVVISVINTYLAIATADYNTKTETATFEIYGVKKSGGEFVKSLTTGSEDKVTGVKVENDDVTVNEIEEDDVVLVTVAQGAVQSVKAAEIVEDVTISAFSKGSKIVVDGTEYKYAETAEYNYEVLDDYDKNNMKEKTYNVYLDSYGNLIGLEYVTVSDNYVFITGINTRSDDKLANGTYKVNGLFLDGTNEVFEAKAKAGTTLTAGEQVNKWYTYTKDNKGVYTLSLVETTWASGDKVAQSYVDDGAEVEIDYKHPSLKMEQGDKSYVYGNNDSVYLTAKLSEVNGKAVISGAANVSVGLKNTSIVTYKDDADKGIAKATTELNEAAYVLFKSNGYIIGAVVVGEDAAVSKNLVYVNSSGPNLEGYAISDDEWTWTREVIQNGVKTELQEVGSELTYLDSMNRYAWYIVSFNAAGNVTNTDLVNVNKTNIEYVSTYTGGAIQTAINTGKETVLYEQDFSNVTEANLPELIEQTLYLDNANRNGFFIDEDAKVVLIQKNSGKTTTTYEVGPAAVKAAIESLNAAADAKYDFELTAVIERGAAQVVIIRDDQNGTAGSGDREDTGTEGIVAVDLSTPSAVTVTWYDAGASKAAADFLNKALIAIEQKIVKNGYTMLPDEDGKYIDSATGNYVFKAKNNGTGFVETFTFAGASAMTEVFKVSYANSGTAGDNWTYTGPQYIKNGESVTVTAKHDKAAVGTAYKFTMTGGVGTASQVGGTATAADKTSTFTTTVTISGDGVIKIAAAN